MEGLLSNIRHETQFLPGKSWSRDQALIEFLINEKYHENAFSWCAPTLYPENPIYVFPEMKLRGLVPSFNIHVSVNDLYIPRIGLPILLQQNRQTDPGNI
jgi:hypothetical protein